LLDIRCSHDFHGWDGTATIREKITSRFIRLKLLNIDQSERSLNVCSAFDDRLLPEWATACKVDFVRDRRTLSLDGDHLTNWTTRIHTHSNLKTRISKPTIREQMANFSIPYAFILGCHLCIQADGHSFLKLGLEMVYSIDSSQTPLEHQLGDKKFYPLFALRSRVLMGYLRS
jgi:hypothetical protein